MEAKRDPGYSPVSILGTVRAFVHRRYVRALITAFSLAVIAGLAGSSALALRHDSSVAAVLRYLGRTHYGGRDLTRLIRNQTTAAQLDELFASKLAVNPGGLVYTDGEALIFHRHVTLEGVASRQEQRDDEEIYANLIPLYFSADLEGLVDEMERSGVARNLGRKGVNPAEISRLRAGLETAGSNLDRRRHLRRAGLLLSNFTPYVGDRYQLTIGEKLRFYERRKPEGRYVGQFEVQGLTLTDRPEDAYALEMSSHHHYLTISRDVVGMFVLTDYFRGESRKYVIRPVPHASGRTLFKVMREI